MISPKLCAPTVVMLITWVTVDGILPNWCNMCLLMKRIITKFQKIVKTDENKKVNNPKRTLLINPSCYISIGERNKVNTRNSLKITINHINFKWKISTDVKRHIYAFNTFKCNLFHSLVALWERRELDPVLGDNSARMLGGFNSLVAHKSFSLYRVPS